jgi:hypothetical protein
VWAAIGVTNEGMERSLDKPATQLILRLHRISPKDTARGGVPESNKSRPECAKAACELFGAAPATLYERHVAIAAHLVANDEEVAVTVTAVMTSFFSPEA